jgi:hypothetical protein
MASEAVSNHLADTEFSIGGTTLTGEQLGLSIDAGRVAEQAHETYPAWNLGGWGTGEVSGPVTIDAEKATEALRTAVPDLYSDSVNAQVVFDAEARRYTTTEAEPGQGVDVQALATSITEALAAGPAEGEPIAIGPTRPASTCRRSGRTACRSRRSTRGWTSPPTPSRATSS